MERNDSREWKRDIVVDGTFLCKIDSKQIQTVFKSNVMKLMISGN